ncbi:hypothetical protein [Barnesiella intestinihominis]|jgi:hypothetical protein|uniref:hypothetical protein n=1 Tax=Barnesiella intestinihominis TaxID=487174 RepID=UPI003FEE3408
MERKVGEIFEYNGEWYQCMEGTGCYRCAFYDKNICIADNPHCTCRSDKKNVIFKKLEKVGDPYVAYGLTRQKYKLHVPLVITNEILDEDISCDEVNGIVDIRAKQNKENMEEKKLNLKPFDLEAAKAGKPVCTRDGRKVRIISFDRHGEDCPIIALVVDSKNAECEEVIDYTLDGICNENIINHNKYDLMMLTRKKEGWVNIYKDFEDTVCCIYSTEKEALEEEETEEDYITTVKIEWEE